MVRRTVLTLPTLLLMSATIVSAQDPPTPAADDTLSAPLKAPGGAEPKPSSPPAIPHHDDAVDQAAPTDAAPAEAAPTDDCPCRDKSAAADSQPAPPMPIPTTTYPPQQLPYGMPPTTWPPVSTGWDGGLHPRYPYYSYRRPWYYRGPASLNVTIPW
ncbi:hypothetical protein [Maioricimonas sp. JC845]|uniref:hypothetical protein n=1 Tax=Maioricimonas sp. JC845 TaxID=3232138 RepID=UPI0034582A2D